MDRHVRNACLFSKTAGLKPSACVVLSVCCAECLQARQRSAASAGVSSHRWASAASLQRYQPTDIALVGPFQAGTVRQLGRRFYLVVYLIFLWTSAPRVQERLFGNQMAVITLRGIRHSIALTILVLLPFGKKASVWNVSYCTLSNNRNPQLPVVFS